MSASLQALTADGNVASGAKLYAHISGASTPSGCVWRKENRILATASGAWREVL